MTAIRYLDVCMCISNLIMPVSIRTNAVFNIPFNIIFYYDFIVVYVSVFALSECLCTMYMSGACGGHQIPWNWSSRKLGVQEF